MKIAFCQLCVTLCGIFGPNEGGVAGYANRIGAKYVVTITVCVPVNIAFAGFLFLKVSVFKPDKLSY